ncbi:hypothetical protein ABGT15_02890 [Flavobacterium enshiense]|uniref:hypothetical protein n=1 Tax=Flavobacterium enshiense TaxID=1341165 RepID=UPI00345DAE26
MKRKPKVNLTRKKKIEERNYRIFIGFAIANVIYWIFFEPLIFGKDIRYDIYVFWIPMLLGIISCSILNVFEFSWRELFSDLKKEKNIFWILFYPIFFLLMHMVFSYMIFGFASRVLWNTINEIESEKNKIEIFHLPVEEFRKASSRSSDKIYFKFKNNLESIPVDEEVIKPYLNANPDDYTIVLGVRKGIWNHYLFESWDLEKD